MSFSGDFQEFYNKLKRSYNGRGFYDLSFLFTKPHKVFAGLAIGTILITILLPLLLLYGCFEKAWKGLGKVDNTMLKMMCYPFILWYTVYTHIWRLLGYILVNVIPNLARSIINNPSCAFLISSILLSLASIAYFTSYAIIPPSIILPFFAVGSIMLAFGLSAIFPTYSEMFNKRLELNSNYQHFFSNLYIVYANSLTPFIALSLAAPLIVLPFVLTLPAWANFAMIVGAALMPFIVKACAMALYNKYDKADPNTISYITLFCGMSALIVAFLPLPVLAATPLVQPALMMVAAVMLGFALANQVKRPSPERAPDMADAIILTLGCAGTVTSCVLLSTVFQAGSAAALWTLALSAIVLFAAIFIAKVNVNQHSQNKGSASSDSDQKRAVSPRENADPSLKSSLTGKPPASSSPESSDDDQFWDSFYTPPKSE